MNMITVMDKEYEVKGGYPMVALQCFEVEDIDSFEEKNIEEVEASVEKDMSVLCLKNLDNSNLVKVVMECDNYIPDEDGNMEYDDDPFGLELNEELKKYFVVIKK